MSDKVKIYTVAHSPKDIVNVKSNELYVPLFVGCNGADNLGFISDDSGDEISSKNPHYCELTGLYWMWKNTDEDIIGLCHYRRYFKEGFRNVLSEKSIIEYLNDYDIILPKKNRLIRGTYKETYKNHYLGEILVITRDTISELFPEYLDTYDSVLSRNDFHNYNMFVAKKKIIDDYCSWVFPILNEIENNIDLEKYPRVLGLVSEFIFNVWIEHNELKVKEVKIKYIGRGFSIKMNIFNNSLLKRIGYYSYKLSKSIFRK